MNQLLQGQGPAIMDLSQQAAMEKAMGQQCRTLALQLAVSGKIPEDDADAVVATASVYASFMLGAS